MLGRLEWQNDERDDEHVEQGTQQRGLLTRQDLERWQVAVYAAAITAGAWIGLGAPSVGSILARGLWPLLAVLLFVTFLQVPLTHLGGAFRHRRYLGALLLGNFVAVPLLGLVLLVITASEIHGVIGALGDLAHVAMLFVIYLVVAPIVALTISKRFRLPEAPRRTVLFSLGTRNSFVVLPLVLAWPCAGPVAASVVVLQLLVELCGMLAYLLIVPRRVRDRNR